MEAFNQSTATPDLGGMYNNASEGVGETMAVLDECSGAGYIPYRDFTQVPGVWWAFVVLYILVLGVSLIGNLMVIYTICRHRYMRTVTNYYILNLAVCDLLISALVMPLKLTEYAASCHWQLVNAPHVLCPVLNYILPVFVFASVFTLVAIAIERYHAIVHPFESRKIHSRSRTLKILACTWAAAILVPTPLIFAKSYPFSMASELGRISRRICTDRFDEIDSWMYGPEAGMSGSFRRGFISFLFMAIYLLPSLIILGTCLRISIALLKPWRLAQTSGGGEVNGGGVGGGMEGRVTRRQEENKRRVARMIIIVALTFIFSWSPFYMVNIVSQVQAVSFLRRSNFLFTMLATHLCGFVNSAINPIVYQAMSDRFRKSFADIVTSIFCCGAKNECTKRRMQPKVTFSGSRTWSRSGQNSTMVTTYCNSNASPTGEVEPSGQSYKALAMRNMHAENSMEVAL